MGSMVSADEGLGAFFDVELEGRKGTWKNAKVTHMVQHEILWGEVRFGHASLSCKK